MDFKIDFTGNKQGYFQSSKFWVTICKFNSRVTFLLDLLGICKENAEVYVFRRGGSRQPLLWSRNTERQATVFKVALKLFQGFKKIFILVASRMVY